MSRNTAITAKTNSKGNTIRKSLHVPADSMILGENQYFELDSYKTKRNNNVLIVGAAGAGKTRSIVTPNLLQATGSYVVSDPKGSLYKEYKDYLMSKGYEVKLLNLQEPDKSFHYNFFHYIKSDQDILKLAHMLVYSTSEHGGTGARGGESASDPFWDRSAELLLIALIGYLWHYRPMEEQNIEGILKLISAAQMPEYQDAKSSLDRVMDEVAKRDPNGITTKYYNRYRVGAIRTRESILITLASYFTTMGTKEVSKLMSGDDMDISSIGRKKTALFVQVSDTDRSMDALANLFFTQAINELCYEADTYCEGYRLPVDVRFILDDFATNVRISQFPRMISSIRSRGISAMIIVQAESQLEQCYGYDAKTIIGNCDTYVYLGCNDVETADSVAKRVNKSLEQILYMPVETAWILRRGEKPVNCGIFPVEAFLKVKLKGTKGKKEVKEKDWLYYKE